MQLEKSLQNQDLNITISETSGKVVFKTFTNYDDFSSQLEKINAILKPGTYIFGIQNQYFKESKLLIMID